MWALCLAPWMPTDLPPGRKSKAKKGGPGHRPQLPDTCPWHRPQAPEVHSTCPLSTQPLSPEHPAPGTWHLTPGLWPRSARLCWRGSGLRADAPPGLHASSTGSREEAGERWCLRAERHRGALATEPWKPRERQTTVTQAGSPPHAGSAHTLPSKTTQQPRAPAAAHEGRWHQALLSDAPSGTVM